MTEGEIIVKIRDMVGEMVDPEMFDLSDHGSCIDPYIEHGDVQRALSDIYRLVVPLVGRSPEETS